MHSLVSGSIHLVAKTGCHLTISHQFFTGDSMNPLGMLGMLDFREDGVTPFMIFFKDGLEVEKVVRIFILSMLVIMEVILNVVHFRLKNTTLLFFSLPLQ
jgi:hypothetical protein